MPTNSLDALSELDTANTQGSVEMQDSFETEGKNAFESVLRTERDVFKTYVENFPDARATAYAVREYKQAFADLPGFTQREITQQIQNFSDKRRARISACDLFLEGDRSTAVTNLVNDLLIEHLEDATRALTQQAKGLYGEDRAAALKDTENPQLNSLRTSVKEALTAFTWASSEFKTPQKIELTKS
jgi:hypothetical protein